mmetsp:Transcript_944/g.2017  ORF Transcript_944/g.2017 Transcript_944/m.2017 type:complete len:82 (+) Transcript_944:84-329(+)
MTKGSKQMLRYNHLVVEDFRLSIYEPFEPGHGIRLKSEDSRKGTTTIERILRASIVLEKRNYSNNCNEIPISNDWSSRIVL